MTNISAAARTVRPLPSPGDRLELEISAPLGLHIWSEEWTITKEDITL